jgi:hypothetical protein
MLQSLPAAWAVLLSLVAWTATTADETPKGPGTDMPAALPKADETKLRKAVYDSSKSTSRLSAGQNAGKRVLNVPTIVVDLHKSHRMRVLEVLSDITKGGRPRDALLAAGYVVALEESDIAAALFASVSEDLVDREGTDADISHRIALVNKVTSLCEAAAKDERRKDGRAKDK